VKEKELLHLRTGHIPIEKHTESFYDQIDHMHKCITKECLAQDEKDNMKKKYAQMDQIWEHKIT
jgi:hypothetical protein